MPGLSYERQLAKRPVQHSEEIPVQVLKTIGVQSALTSPMMNHMLKLHSVVIMKALYWIGSSPPTFNLFLMNLVIILTSKRCPLTFLLQELMTKICCPLVQK